MKKQIIVPKKKIKKPKYKYNVINHLGKEEPWTGLFKSLPLCETWYNKYGKEFEKQGHKLVFVTT